MRITDKARAAAEQALVDRYGTTGITDFHHHVVNVVLNAAVPHLLADDETSDGFHTVGEIYYHRMLLNAALFRSWREDDLHPLNQVLGVSTGPHKSWRHSDGGLCFGGGWFIVVAQLPTGQVSYHYPAEHWDLFRIPEREIPAPYDGHTPTEAAARIRQYLEA